MEVGEPLALEATAHELDERRHRLVEEIVADDGIDLGERAHRVSDCVDERGAQAVLVAPKCREAPLHTARCGVVPEPLATGRGPARLRHRPRRRAVATEGARKQILVEVDDDVEAAITGRACEACDGGEVGVVICAALGLDRFPRDEQADRVHAPRRERIEPSRIVER
jgi:hypothetical protein